MLHLEILHIDVHLARTKLVQFYDQEFVHALSYLTNLGSPLRISILKNRGISMRCCMLSNKSSISFLTCDLFVLSIGCRYPLRHSPQVLRGTHLQGVLLGGGTHNRCRQQNGTVIGAARGTGTRDGCRQRNKPLQRVPPAGRTPASGAASGLVTRGGCCLQGGHFVRGDTTGGNRQRACMRATAAACASAAAAVTDSKNKQR